MKRRDFITLLGGAAAAWPLGARAQQPAMPVVGFLHLGSGDTFAYVAEAFRQGLRQGGYVEGQSVAIDYCWADGNPDRLPALAAGLVQRQVAVIAAMGASALAAKTATTTIPIVFTHGADPVRLGIVASLARPGGNITGISFLVQDLSAKALGLLHAIAPNAAAVALLINPDDPAAQSVVADAQTAARTLGLVVKVLNVTNSAEVDQAFATLTQHEIGALMVGSTLFMGSRLDQIAVLAARYRIPAIFSRREFPRAGGLISYGTSITDAYRQAGIYVTRILKGEKPSDLPVMQASKFELVINLKAAKALGLVIPPGVLAIADEVIE
jgi:putative ABC transport system substrate-binding protein